MEKREICQIIMRFKASIRTEAEAALRPTEVDEEVRDEGASLLGMLERDPRPAAKCYVGCVVRLGSMRQLFVPQPWLLRLASTMSCLESCEKRGPVEGNIVLSARASWWQCRGVAVV